MTHVRACTAGASRRSRRPRPRTRRPLPWWALVPDSFSSPPMANDGSSPQCCSATTSIEVVEVLPWVPATQERCGGPPSATRAPQAAGGSGSRARAAATSSGLSLGMAASVVTTAVGPPVEQVEGARRRARCGPARPGRADRRAPRDLLGVRPGDLTAAGQQDPGDPGHPGATDPDHVHALESCAGNGGHRVLGCSTRSSAPVARRGQCEFDAAAATACRRSGARSGGRSSHRRPAAAGSVQQRRPWSRPRTRASGRRRRRSAAPPAATDAGGVEPLLPVAVRKRDVDRGQTDRRRPRRRSSPRSGRRQVGGRSRRGPSVESTARATYGGGP